VEHLAVFSFLVADKMKERHVGFAAQLMNELALPEEHNVALHADCFFNFGGEHLASFALFNLVKFTEGTATNLLDNTVALVKDFLTLLKHSV